MNAVGPDGLRGMSAERGAQRRRRRRPDAGVSVLRRSGRQPVERGREPEGRIRRSRRRRCSRQRLDRETIDWVETWTQGSLGSLGRFQLRERLGDGGFGQVFRAYDPRLDRDVALKVLKQPDPSERVMERFFREARAVARLDHPNIVAVHDAGFDDGRCWVAYQLVSGRTALVVSRPPSDGRRSTAARIIRDLADALDHAHQHGSRASRPQAGQRADRRPGPAAPDRLRPGPPVRPRVGPDPRRRDRRDAGLHEPRAGHRPEPAGRRAERRLQPGRHLLRAALRRVGRRNPARDQRSELGRPRRRRSAAASARSTARSAPARAICAKAMAVDPVGPLPVRPRAWPTSSTPGCGGSDDRGRSD